MVWRFHKKLGIKPPYDPVIPLLDTYTEETKMEKTHVPQCSLQHSLQYVEHGNNLDVHQQMNDIEVVAHKHNGMFSSVHFSHSVMSDSL